MKEENKCRFILRWLVLGWWLVPILLGMRFLAELQEHYWTGDDTEIHWHTNEDITAAIGWINAILKIFSYKVVK